MISVDYIFHDFKITEEEYAELDKEFGKLCYKAAWELKKKNFKNNYTDEIEDIVQDLRWSMSKACMYIKRQRYILSSMDAIDKFCKDPFTIELMTELKELWDNRKRHGANKQKFGFWQEQVLDKLVANFVPEDNRPKKNSKLDIDQKFENYCKSNIWNWTKNLGKKITRERSIRAGLCSLSEYDYLGSV